LRRLGLLTLLAFDLILFAPLLVRGRVFSSHDFVRAHHPWRETSRGVLEADNRLLSDPAASGQTTLLRYRSFPAGLFWNPWISSGAVGPLQIAQGFLSPFVALPSLLLPEAGIETGILFLKLQFAFAAAYLFLRSRRFSDLAAAVGAATWAFSTGQTVWALWMQTSVSVTYPLLLASVDRALEEPRGARAITFGALCFLLCLSGGFPHWIAYGAAAAALYLLGRIAARRGRGGLRALLRLAISAAIAGAILLPAILLSVRFLRDSGYGALREGMGREFSLPLRHLRLYFLPEYQGTVRRDDYRGVGWIPGDNYVETAVGVGLLAGGLAAVGLARLKQRGLALYAALLAAAVALPLYAGGAPLRLVGSLPLLENALFARSKILILLAVAILAACGAEGLEAMASDHPVRRSALRLSPLAIAVPLAFLALDFHPIAAPDDAVFRETPGIARLRRVDPSAPGRFAAAGWTLLPNVSEVFGLEDVRGHFLHDAAYRRFASAADPYAFGHYGTYLLLHPASFDPSSPVLDFLNVTALAAPPGAERPTGVSVEGRDAAPMPLPPGGRPSDASTSPFPRVYAGQDLTIFERPSALPRFFLVARALPGGVEEARVADRATLASAVFVPPAVARRLAGAEADRGASGFVRVLAFEPERFLLEVASERPTLLVSSQKRFPPYWRTFLDGRPVASFEANGPFLGLELPAGRHRVEGRFAIPPPEIAVSAGGFALLLAAMIAALRDRRAAAGSGGDAADGERSVP
jgi:hypothetical protein